MENILPALLIIVGVIYKIYTEYQKEQEKARRRMPQVPHTQPLPTDEYVQPTLSEPLKPTPVPALPPIAERIESIPEEWRPINYNRMLEKEDKKEKIITVNPVVDLEEEVEGTLSFDLREAVIQSAILERPHS